MTHVNNAKGEAVEEEERQMSALILAPAAGRSSAYRFLDAAESSSSSASQVDAVDSVNTAATTTTTTTTAANCLEECHFAACQTKATSSSDSNWHEDFCITDDELEYEDELLFSSSSAAATTAAATPALECALLGFGLGGGEREQQNEQLLMEGIFVMSITQRDLVTLARERFIDSFKYLANDRLRSITRT